MVMFPALHIPAQARRASAKRRGLMTSTNSEFRFVEHLDSGPVYEHIVPVTDNELPIIALAQPF